MRTIVEEVKRARFRKTYAIRSDRTIVLLISGRKKQQIQISVDLGAPGSKAVILGVVVGNNSDSITLQTLQHHRKPDTVSNLLVKSLLRAKASFVYDGSIRVEPKAQKTDAYQRNENLLLSKDAYAESKPKLEILANDVRCTHGATISSVRSDELWYLSTRGIDKAQGSTLIARGFLGSVADKVGDKNAQRKIHEFINSAI